LQLILLLSMPTLRTLAKQFKEVGKGLGRV
jgi:hypothetical protein